MWIESFRTILVVKFCVQFVLLWILGDWLTAHPWLFALSVGLVLEAIEVAAQFAVARWLRDAPYCRPWLAWLREYRAWLVFSVRQVFDARRQVGGGPWTVVLVHGYACNGAVFGRWRRLAALGVRIRAVDLEPWIVSLEHNVELLTRALEDHRGENLILVGHSMGAVTAVQCLARDAELRRQTRLLVSIGAPHRGTRMSSWVLTPGDGPMPRDPDRVLPDLDIPVLTMTTTDDNLVVPASSSVWPGARHVEWSGVGHLSLLNYAPAVTTVGKAISTTMELHNAANG